MSPSPSAQRRNDRSSASKANPKKQTPHYKLTTFYYEPVRSSALLTALLKINFKHLAPAKKDRFNVAFVPKTSELYILTREDEARHKSLLEVARLRQQEYPWMTLLTGVLRLFAPKSKRFGGLLQVREDGEIIIANRLRMNLSQAWLTPDGLQAELYNITKLPNGLIADIKAFNPHNKGLSYRFQHSKEAKDKVLTLMDDVEHDGFLLETAPFITEKKRKTEDARKQAKITAAMPSMEMTLRPSFLKTPANVVHSKLSVPFPVYTQQAQTLKTEPQNTAHQSLSESEDSSAESLSFRRYLAANLAPEE